MFCSTFLRGGEPGSILWRMRVRYTAGHKLALLMMAMHLQNKEGILLRKSAERVQVSALLLTRWEECFSLGNNPIKALLKNKKKSIHPSPLSQLKPLEEALLKYIFALYPLLWWRQTSPPHLAKRTLLQGAAPSSALCVLICLSIKWACTYASASQRKLRRRQATTCTSVVPSYLALIATGVSSSTCIKRQSNF
jgi:hypothetical protein